MDIPPVLLLLLLLVVVIIVLVVHSLSLDGCREFMISHGAGIGTEIHGEVRVSDLPIFVINLRSRPDKRRKTLAQLARHNLIPTFITAVDGRDLNLETLVREGTIRIDGDRPLRRGEIGCFMSHLSAWHKILETGKPYGLIFEDDIKLDPAFRHKANEVLDVMRDKRWDIIYLGRYCDKSHSYYQQCILGEGISEDVMYPKAVGWGNFAYIIKADTIQRLLPLMYPLQKPIDVVLPEMSEAGSIKTVALRRDVVDVMNKADSDTERIV